MTIRFEPLPSCGGFVASNAWGPCLRCGLMLKHHALDADILIMNAAYQRRHYDAAMWSECLEGGRVLRAVMQP